MSAEENLLNKILGIYYTANALAGIFLSVFLFNLGGFKAVVQFGFIIFVTAYIVYLLSSWLLKTISSTALIKIGLLAATFFYALLVLLQENSINFLLLLGFFNGASIGCFWSGFNLSQYILSHEHTRNAFFGRQKFLTNIASTFGPLISGGIIGYAGIVATKSIGYTAVFAIVAILMLYAFFESEKLPEHKGIEFRIFHIFQHVRSRGWKIVLLQQFLMGFYDAAITVIVTILVFLIVKQEFTLGVLNFFVGIVLAFSYIGAARLLQKNKQSIVLAMIFPPIGILIFAFLQNYIGIILLIVFHFAFYPLLDITLSKSYFDTIDKAEGSWQNKYHFIIERESVLNLSRAATYLVLFVFVTPTNQIQVARLWLLAVPMLIIAIGALQFYKFRVAQD